MTTPTDIVQAKGPHTPTATSWCGLPDLMWFVFQSAHWLNRQDYGTLLEGAQEGSDIRDQPSQR